MGRAAGGAARKVKSKEIVDDAGASDDSNRDDNAGEAAADGGKRKSHHKSTKPGSAVTKDGKLHRKRPARNKVPVLARVHLCFCMSAFADHHAHL